MNRFIVLLSCLSAALFAAQQAVAHEGHDDLPSTGVAVNGNRLTVSPQAEKSLGIATTVVHLKDLERDVMANATVEIPWLKHAYATSLVSGRIADVLVQPGSTVQEGEVLAQVESQEIESLQLDLLKSSAELKLATRLLEQRGGLESSGSISERRVLETQATRDQWAAQRGIAIRKLLSLGFTGAMIDEVLSTGKQLRTVPITSPLAGVISVAQVHVGQVVEPWQQVYEIVDLSKMWIHGQVLETDSTAVAEGQPVEVLVDAVPSRTFRGIVGHVGVKLDPELRSLHVHVEVDNSEGLLREGMFGRLRIRAQVAREAVACPSEAIVDPGGSPWVLVQQRRGTFIRQPVKLGLRSGDLVEILDGLFPGDPVVTTGRHELASLFQRERATGDALASRNAPQKATAGAAPTVIAQAQIELPTNKRAAAYSTVTGRIARVLVEHGEPVKAGQALAEVESLELRNVQLELLQTGTKLRLSRKLLDRYSRLNAAGGIAERDLWEAQTENDNLQSTAASLKNKLALMGLSAEEIQRVEQVDITDMAASDAIVQTAEIRAPIDGRITLFDLSIGQVVRPQDEMFEIHDVSRVVARGYVHEQDSSEVAIGEPVITTITADASFSAPGVIDRAAPTLSTFGRAMSVWVELDNPSGILKEGMLARLAITPRPASGDTVVAPRQRPE